MGDDSQASYDVPSTNDFNLTIEKAVDQSSVDGYIIVKVKDSSGNVIAGPHALTDANPTWNVEVPAGGKVTFTDPSDANSQGAIGTVTVN